MSAKVLPCECPICRKIFKCRHDQMRKAVESGREVPCCSNRCERERRYGASRDAKYAAAMKKTVDGLTGAK